VRKKSNKPKIEKSTGKERKAFAVRMIGENKNIVWMAELKAAKDIFLVYPVDFLNKVKKPPFHLNSLFFFLSEDGKKYLNLKLKEYLYKPKSYDIVEEEEKVGEDWNGEKKRGFREFLNEEFN
jgi:hypothetical protein